MSDHLARNEERLLKEKIESQERLVRTLDAHSAGTMEAMAGMLTDAETKSCDKLGDRIEEQGTKVAEVYKSLSKQIGDLEKLVRSLADARNVPKVTPTKGEKGARSEGVAMKMRMRREGKEMSSSREDSPARRK